MTLCASAVGARVGAVWGPGLASVLWVLVMAGPAWAQAPGPEVPAAEAPAEEVPTEEVPPEEAPTEEAPTAEVPPDPPPPARGSAVDPPEPPRPDPAVELARARIGAVDALDAAEAAIAAAEDEQADRRAQSGAAVAAIASTAHTLSEKLATAEADGASVRALYTQARALADTARARLRAALDPPPRPEPAAASATTLATLSTVPGLEDLVAREADLEERRRRLDERWEDDVSAALATARDQALSTEELRLDVAAVGRRQLPDEFAPISSIGFAALPAEAELVGLRTRAFLHERWADRTARLRSGVTGDRWVERSVDIASWLAWTVLFVFSARLLPSLVSARLGALRSALDRRLRSGAPRRAARRILGEVVAVLPQATWLVAVLLIGQTLPAELRNGWVWLVWRVVLAFAVWRAATAAGERIGLATHVSGGDRDRRPLVDRSARRIGGWAATALVATAVSLTLTGEGTITAWVRTALTLAAVGVGFVLMQDWREQVVTAYLGRWPDGSFARAVRASRNRWYGLPVAVVAFAVVGVSAAWRAIQGFVLGFEQFRRALTYMVRRRLEQAPPAPEDQALPDEVVARFDAPLPPLDPASERFVGRDVLDAALAAWRKAPGVTRLLVVGDIGAGRSTWLSAAALRVPDVPVVHGRCERVHRDAQVLRVFLAELFGAPSDAAASATALGTWIGEQPPRVLVLDDVGRLWLRVPGGRAAWDELRAVLRAAGDRVFVIASTARPTWEHMRWALRDSAPFATEIMLPPWSEEELATLLASRVEGIPLAWDDLLVADDRDAPPAGSLREDYFRHLWDHSGGSATAALYAWRRSLVARADGSICVRAWRPPDPSLLDALSMRDRLVIAAVAWHGEVTAAEAAAVLRYPLERAFDRLDRLSVRGVFSRVDGVYAVTPPWSPVVQAWLRRKHLINE